MKRTERELGVEVAVASTTAKVASTSAIVASMSATAMHIDLEVEAGPTATQDEAGQSEAATPCKRA
jgi:gamma-glutamyl:cysteine ligase YbdK (ATP-grasp superfamily)